MRKSAFNLVFIAHSLLINTDFFGIIFLRSSS